MAEERAHRRLAAILAADVVGYTHLMERDEAGTLAVLKARRSQVLQPLVSKHRGRIVKLMGGGALSVRPDIAPMSKPSIAVLPFTNLSGDASQDYFSWGITENIITNLSRFRDLLVIARHSALAYEDKAMKIQEVSRQLGVRYV